MYVYAHTCSKRGVCCSLWRGCSSCALALRLIHTCIAGTGCMSQVLYSQYKDICYHK